MGVYLGFYLHKGETITVNIGTSFADENGARQNLISEVGTKSFEQIKAAATAVWNKALAAIAVTTNNEKHKFIFIQLYIMHSSSPDYLMM